MGSFKATSCIFNKLVYAFNMMHSLYGISHDGLISKPRVWARIRRFLPLLLVENFRSSLAFLCCPSAASCFQAYSVQTKNISRMRIIKKINNISTNKV